MDKPLQEIENVVRAAYPPPASQVDAAMRDDDFFWRGIADNQLLVQRCDDCGSLRHPPLPMCSDCHSLSWTPRAVSGRARLYTWILSRPPGEPGAPARVVALVELDEGIRLVSNLVDCDIESLAVELPLELCFTETDGGRLPQFRVALED